MWEVASAGKQMEHISTLKVKFNISRKQIQVSFCVHRQIGFTSSVFSLTLFQCGLVSTSKASSHDFMGNKAKLLWSDKLIID